MSSDMEGKMQTQIEGAISENERLRESNADLAAALQAILSGVEDFETCPSEYMQMARAALAKAGIE